MCYLVYLEEVFANKTNEFLSSSYTKHSHKSFLVNLDFTSGLMNQDITNSKKQTTQKSMSLSSLEQETQLKLNLTLLIKQKTPKQLTDNYTITIMHD